MENEPLIANETASEPPVAAPFDEGERDSTDRHPEGICVTCSRREGCSKRTSEGGIWRCPDYEE